MEFAARQRIAQLSQLRPVLHWAYEGEVADWALSHVFDDKCMAVWFLQSGTCTLRYGEDQERYRAPCWILPRRQLALQRFSKGSRLLSIRFLLNWADEQPVYAQEVSHRFAPGAYPRFERCAKALVRCIQKIPGEGMLVYMREASLDQVMELQVKTWQWVREYLSVLDRLQVSLVPPRAQDSRVSKALEYIRAHPLADRFSEQQLASHCGLSVSQLNRLFQKEVGFSPALIFQRRRMSVAHSALVYSDQSIKSLAIDLGFSSPQHFSTWFRQRNHGVTPTEYRKQH